MKTFLFEAVGWLITAIGASLVFRDASNVLYYIILIIGIVIVLFNIPMQLRRYRK